MKRLVLILLVISSFMSFATRASESELITGRGSSTARVGTYVPGELLVKYKPSVRAMASEYSRSRWGVATVRIFKRIGVQQVRLPKDMTVEEALEIFHNDADVEYVEPNYLRYATATTPNDTFYSNLWGLNNPGDTDIDAPEAWDITTGNSNVVVAVLDSGVDYNHPDLAANIWANPDEIAGNAIDDDGNGFIDDVQGWDFVDDDNNPIDMEDHGTHVAGTIAAEGNNGIGITGVTWTAKIMVLRFLDGFGVGSVVDEIEAIDYAITKGARIINASFGSYNTDSIAERNAIASARDAGILFVAAAGNDDWDNDTGTKHYPSSYDLANIIAVAATDQSDSRAYFSNYGAISVDVAAPGTMTYSAKPPGRIINVFSDNFESGTGKWNLNAPWGLSNTVYFGGSNSLTDSPADIYGDDIDISARNSVALALSGRSRARLTFKLRGESGTGDLLSVETASNGGGPWTNRNVIIGTGQPTFENGISGSSSGQWVDATVELDLLDGSNDGYFHLRFQTDQNTDLDDGWYIDNVTISAADVTYANPQSQYYQYLQGTSMATPHVAGLAALIWGLDLDQTYAEIKQRVLNGVEVKSDLKGIILTGGRINAFNSVRNVPTSPSNLSGTAVSSSKIDLNWSDNSYGEEGFRIERRKSASGIFSQIAVVSANTTSYSDTGLDELTTYYYRVSAFRGINTSDFSTNTSVTTSATTTSSGSGGGGGGGSGGCFLATAGF